MIQAEDFDVLETGDSQISLQLTATVDMEEHLRQSAIRIDSIPELALAIYQAAKKSTDQPPRARRVKPTLVSIVNVHETAAVRLENSMQMF